MNKIGSLDTTTELLMSSMCSGRGAGWVSI